MRQVLVPFSGGIDSTFTAAKLAPTHERLLLVTYRVPGMVNVDFSRRSFERLRARFGAKVEHEIIDIRGFVYQVRGGVRKCLGDHVRYGFYYSWCLGCKLSMHLTTVDACRRHGIGVVADGNNRFDAHAMEQRRDVLAAFARMYKAAGIEYGSPFYEQDDVVVRPGRWAAMLRTLTLLKDSTPSRVRFLREAGIECGPGLLDQYRANQPSCLVSPVFNCARILLSAVRPESISGALSWLEDRAAPWSPALGPFGVPRRI